MRHASFYFPENKAIVNSIDRPIDLERELLSRGFPLASHGRIDWDKIPRKEVFNVENDNEAADAVVKIIRDRALSGEIMIVWTDAGVNPITIDAGMISKYALQICEEDWDCWIISAAGGWVIEKYHEGEVCFAVASGE